MAIQKIALTVTETIEYERVIEAESDLSEDDFAEQVAKLATAWNDDPTVGFQINGIRYDLTGIAGCRCHHKRTG
jgi:hypothetical protein